MVTFRALARLLSAFRRVTLTRLADAFGWTQRAMADYIDAHAKRGQIRVNIDWYAKVIESRDAQHEPDRDLLQHTRATAGAQDRLALAANMAAEGYVKGS